LAHADIIAVGVESVTALQAALMTHDGGRMQ